MVPFENREIKSLALHKNQEKMRKTIIDAVQQRYLKIIHGPVLESLKSIFHYVENSRPLKLLLTPSEQGSEITGVSVANFAVLYCYKY